MRQPKSPAPPKLTHAPWAGYTAREHKRETPLDICPSPRCRRAKACIAAHDDLYCQRTHLSHVAFKAAQPRKPSPPTTIDLEERREMLIAQIEERRAAHQDKVRQWKAGLFDHLYGKYKAGGVVLEPPPRNYVEP